MGRIIDMFLDNAVQEKALSNFTAAEKKRQVMSIGNVEEGRW
jgi:hypothetical protein